MLLTATITTSSHPSHHVLASRALIRARLQDWDAALIDAKKVFIVPILRSLTPTLIYPRLSRFNPPSSPISQRVWPMSEMGKGTRLIALAILRSSTFTRLILVFSSSLRSVSCQLHRGSTVHLTSGYHRVHGRRLPRCDSPHRRPHRYGAFQFHMLHSSGTCTTSSRVGNRH